MIQAATKTVLGTPDAPLAQLHLTPPPLPPDLPDEEPPPRKHFSPIPGGFPMFVSGMFVASVGFLLILFYWLIYDTSVAEFPGAGILPGTHRTHNLGLMLNRMVGIIVGASLWIGGIVVSGRKLR